MKKLIYSFLILGTAFSLASCSADEPSKVGNDGNVRLTVQLPNELATRFADAGSINKLYFSVCTTGENAKVLDNYSQDWPEGQTATTVNIPLIPGQEYQVVFFACNSGATNYTYDAATAGLTVTYADAMTNNDAYDAFYAVEGEISSATQGKTITLNRPFAQLNIGTDDADKGIVKDFIGNGGNYSSTLTIEKTGLLGGINFLSGETTAAANDVTFTLEKVELGLSDDYPVEGNTYLEMNYLLVDLAATDATLLNATYNIQADGAVVNDLNLSALPVRANYQTNVYGSLLTTKNQFNVKINEGFAGQPYDYFNAALVKMVDGKVVCEKPLLPKGVSEADVEGQGGVYIDENGEPQIFPATEAGMIEAMKNGEVYMAPNTTITAGAHHLVVTNKGVTIHGNGATINSDLSINYGTGINYDYYPYGEGLTININLENVNNAMVWGIPKVESTFNINMKNCTMAGTGRADGSHYFVNSRVSDKTTININLDNCYVQDVQSGFHCTAKGEVNVKNCTFVNNGIGINLAKKEEGGSLIVNVDNSKFIDCGILPTDTSNTAYDYAAPIRVVDNGGPADSTVLTINGCTVTGTLSEWDVLLMDYRSDRKWSPVKYTITNSGDLTVRSE